MQEFGYHLVRQEDDSYYAFVNSNQQQISFHFLPEQGLISKQYSVYDDVLESGMWIDELMAMHKEKYLSVSGFDIEWEDKPNTVRDHRVAVFYKDDFMGRIQLVLHQSGKVSGSYVIEKLIKN